MMYKSSISKTEVEDVEMEGAKDITIQWLLKKDHGVPNFEMRRFTIKKGGHTPYHQHDFEHEIYVMSGQGAMKFEGEDHPLHPEDVIYVPANDWHQFRNSGDSDFVFMCLVPKMD
ncbi:MAG: cupin domain-containing protein [Candidatus Thermoplasmatota archaeon]|nr:cupin domain-containing protein [Candidatus Thermoplasmatota archaeon]